MDDYVSLPAQRFVHLVRKYVHHVRMKEVEGEHTRKPPKTTPMVSLLSALYPREIKYLSSFVLQRGYRSPT